MLQRQGAELRGLLQNWLEFGDDRRCGMIHQHDAEHFVGCRRHRFNPGAAEAMFAADVQEPAVPALEAQRRGWAF